MTKITRKEGFAGNELLNVQGFATVTPPAWIFLSDERMQKKDSFFYTCAETETSWGSMVFSAVFSWKWGLHGETARLLHTLSLETGFFSNQNQAGSFLENYVLIPALFWSFLNIKAPKKRRVCGNRPNLSRLASLNLMSFSSRGFCSLGVFAFMVKPNT